MTHHSDTVKDAPAGSQSVEERWIEVLTDEYGFATWKATRIIRAFQANEHLRMGSPSSDEVRQSVSSAIEQHGFDAYDEVDKAQSVVEDLKTVLEQGLADELTGPNSYRPDRLTDVALDPDRADFAFTDPSQSGALIDDPALERTEAIPAPGGSQGPAEIVVDVRSILRVIVRQNLPDSLNVTPGSGAVIDREAALSALVSADQSPTVIDSLERAEAVVDHFIANGILHGHDTDIVVLADPESLANAAGDDTGDDTPILLNWLSAIEVCVATIRQLIDVMAGVLDDLIREIGEFDLAETAADYERKRDDVVRELIELTDDRPLDISDLAEPDVGADDDNDSLIDWDALIESIDQSTEIDEEIQQLADEISTYIRNLQTTEGVLEAHIHRLTQVYTHNASIAHDEATDLAANLAALADDMARASVVTEREARDDDIVAFGDVLLDDVRNFETLGHSAGL